MRPKRTPKPPFSPARRLPASTRSSAKNPPWAGVWRRRLALSAAAASVRRAGRAEDEAALRDAFHLTRPGGDPGPAGKFLLARAIRTRARAAQVWRAGRSRGSGIAARPGEVERIAQRGLVFSAAGAAHACRGGAQGQPPAPDAGPRRVFADDRVEAGKRRAGEKGGFGVSFRAHGWPAPKPETAAARRPEGFGSLQITTRKHRKRTPRRRFRLGLREQNRRACRLLWMSDKVALSDDALYR